MSVIHYNATFFSFLSIDRPGLHGDIAWIRYKNGTTCRKRKRGIGRLRVRPSRTRYDTIPSPSLLVNASTVVRNNLLDGSSSRRGDAIARWRALARAGNEPASSGPPPTCLKYTKRRLCSRARARTCSPGMQTAGTDNANRLPHWA